MLALFTRDMQTDVTCYISINNIKWLICLWFYAPLALDDTAANIQNEMLHCSLLACYSIYKSRLTYYSETSFILLSSVSIFLDAAAADIFFVIPVQFLLIHIQIARLRLQNVSVFLNFRPSYTQQQESFTSIGRFSNITALGERHSS